MSIVRSIARGLLIQRTPRDGEDVQHVHAEDHLLERAARKPAHDQQVERIEHVAVGPEHMHVPIATDLGPQPRGRDREHVVAAIGERIQQPARVPGAGRAENPDPKPAGHLANERSSTSGASPPPWCARPDSVLVSVTAAGLNSIGSTS